MAKKRTINSSKAKNIPYARKIGFFVYGLFWTCSEIFVSMCPSAALCCLATEKVWMSEKARTPIITTERIFTKRFMSKTPSNERYH